MNRNRNFLISHITNLIDKLLCRFMLVDAELEPLKRKGLLKLYLIKTFFELATYF